MSKSKQSSAMVYQKFIDAFIDSNAVWALKNSQGDIISCITTGEDYPDGADFIPLWSSESAAAVYLQEGLETTIFDLSNISGFLHYLQTNGTLVCPNWDEHKDEILCEPRVVAEDILTAIGDPQKLDWPSHVNYAPPIPDDEEGSFKRSKWPSTDKVNHLAADYPLQIKKLTKPWQLFYVNKDTNSIEADYILFYGKRNSSPEFQKFVIYLHEKPLPTDDEQLRQHLIKIYQAEMKLLQVKVKDITVEELKQSTGIIELGGLHFKALVVRHERIVRLLTFLICESIPFYLQIVAESSRFKSDLHNLKQLFSCE